MPRHLTRGHGNLHPDEGGLLEGDFLHHLPASRHVLDTDHFGSRAAHPRARLHGEDDLQLLFLLLGEVQLPGISHVQWFRSPRGSLPGSGATRAPSKGCEHSSLGGRTSCSDPHSSKVSVAAVQVSRLSSSGGSEACGLAGSDSQAADGSTAAVMMVSGAGVSAPEECKPRRGPGREA